MFTQPAFTRSPRPGAAQTGLAALGLLALVPSAVRAQSLDLAQGSALIVHDATGSGTFLNSTNYTFGGGASPATYQYDEITNSGGPVTLTLATGSLINEAAVAGIININGGTVTTLRNYGGDSAAGPSTTNITAGSVNFLQSYSNVSVTGGTVNEIDNFSHQISISGGTLGNVSGDAGGQVTNGDPVEVTGGTINNLSSFDSFLSVSGGTIATLNVGGFNITNPASVTISGGTITLLNASKPFGYQGGGGVVVSGGTTGTVKNTGDLVVSGGSIGILDNSNQAEIDPGASITADINEAKSMETILGGSLGALTNYGTTKLSTGGTIGALTNYGAFYSGDPNGHVSGTMTNLYERGGTAYLYSGQFSFLDNFTGGTIDVYGRNLVLANGFLTGTLLDGQPIDAAYQNDGGTLNFNPPVPEASTTVSFGLLLALGLGGLVASRRKKVVP